MTYFDTHLILACHLSNKDFFGCLILNVPQYANYCKAVLL